MLDQLCSPAPRMPNASRRVVSFLVITYGRAAKQPQMLNEAVGWCCNQDYPNVEVLVLNDAPNQTLTCREPNVRCVNWPERIPDLGTKMNVATALAAGDVCCPAEDDDISLPNRATQAVQMLTGPWDCWFPMRWVFSHANDRDVIDGNGHGYTSSAFRRCAMLGNHPKAIKGHDQAAAAWMRENLRVRHRELTDGRDVSYVYRWGVSPLHLSGHPDPEKAFRENDPGPAGTYEIVPCLLRRWDKVRDDAAADFNRVARNRESKT